LGEIPYMKSAPVVLPVYEFGTDHAPGKAYFSFGLKCSGW